MENLAKNSNQDKKIWKFSDIIENNNLDKSLIKTLLNDPLAYVCPPPNSCLSSKPFLIAMSVFYLTVTPSVDNLHQKILQKNSNRESKSWKFSDINQNNDLDRSLIKTLLKWSTVICLSHHVPLVFYNQTMIIILP